MNTVKSSRQTCSTAVKQISSGPSVNLAVSVRSARYIGSIHDPFTDTHLLYTINISAGHANKLVAQTYLFQELYLSQTIQ